MDSLVLSTVLTIAMATDLRRREVPVWLTFGAIATGLIASILEDRHGVVAAVVGLAARLVQPLPFVLLGGVRAGRPAVVRDHRGLGGTVLRSLGNLVDDHGRHGLGP